MKTIKDYSTRNALAVLATGLALGCLFAVSTPASPYRMQLNYPSTTPAPYNAGGGVPAQALLTLTNQTSTNCTLGWYGMMGWYSVQGSPDLLSWTTLTNVEVSNFAWSSTVTNPFGATAYFRLNQSNSYAGQGVCSGCHGDKYTPWSATPHAGAYNTLLSAVPPSVAFGAGCIVCHSVGYGQPTGFTNISTTPNLANVGCESCHGPAGWHQGTDHNIVHPAVSMDPSICGSCHQGSHHPTYEEYATSGHAKPSQSAATGAGCAFCHQANNRMVLLNEYNDMLAGNSHPVTLYTGLDATNWTATCATCHDPHSDNQVGQLRYPTHSTNWFTMPTVFDTRTVKTTNGTSVTTSTVNYNTVFDSLYNPNVQVCGQCHNTRGARWDGNAYAVITNTPILGPVTNKVYVDIYCTNVITQVFTNSQGVPYLTNTYNQVYACGRYATTNVALSQTNPLYSVGVVTPLVYYTNLDLSIGVGTNSSGYSRVPHPTAQYNVLIGMADYDYATVAGVPNKTHAHTSAPDQCTTCHVPNYSVNANTNVTGHTFDMDYNGCLTSCHSTYTPDGLTAKIENLQFIESNNMVRVVSMLNQWALTKTAGTALTNYGMLAWEYTTPGAWGTKYTNSGIKYLVGPPSTFAYKTNLPTPNYTNDNLQLLIPQDIRIARNDLYTAYNDESYGVHNPTYTQALLDDAAARVGKQFTSANFSATPVSGFAGMSVQFTNVGTGITTYSWNFGDGVGTSTSANPTYVYNTPGIYTVTFTANGTETLSKTNYIRVLTQPTFTITADNTSIGNGQTVNFTINTTNNQNVYLFRWYPMFNISSSYYTALPGSTTNYSFTYTNGGTYSVELIAYCPGGASGSYNRVYVTNVNYISVGGAMFTALTTKGTAPLTVGFTNQSIGSSNYFWNFGDGNTSTAANPVNIYTNAGTYTATLSAVYNGVTNTMVRSNYIVVNPPAVAFTGSPTAGLAPLTVTFVNTSSNVVVVSTNVTTCFWTFGDGGTSTNVNPVYTYTNAGTNSVTLQVVTPGKTNTLTRTNYIVVSPVPPVPTANFTATPANGFAPLTVTFTNLSSNATSYLWNFGDGSTATSTNIVHTYTNGGPYTVTLQAVGNGVTNTVTQVNCIHVAIPAPVPAFAATPTNGWSPLTVTFTNMSANATSYLWTFGDGQTSTTANPVHVYTATNTRPFTVTLQAVGAGVTNVSTGVNFIHVAVP